MLESCLTRWITLQNIHPFFSISGNWRLYETYIREFVCVSKNQRTYSVPGNHIIYTSLGRFLPSKNLQKLIRDPTVLMNCLLRCSVKIPDQFFQIYCRFLGGWFSVDLAPFLRRFCMKGAIEDASVSKSSSLFNSENKNYVRTVVRTGQKPAHWRLY